MAEIARLGITVDASGAIGPIEKVDTALTKLGKTGDATDARSRAWLKQTNAARAAAEFAAYSKEIDKSTRLLNQLVSVTDKHDRGAIAGLKELTQQQRAWATSVGASAEQMLKITAIENRLNQSHASGVHGVGRLESGFASLATQLSGVDPIVGHMAGVLGAFAVGSTLTVGILAGLALIAYAYNEIGGKARAAKKEVDDLITSLNRQAKSEFDATVQGKRKNFLTAEQESRNAKAALARFNDTGGTGPLGLGAKAEENLKAQVKSTATATREAAKNLRDAKAEESKGYYDAYVAADKAGEALNKLADKTKGAGASSNTGAESVARLRDEIERAHQAATSFGKDDSVDVWMLRLNQEFTALEKQYPKQTAALEALRVQLAKVGGERKTRLADDQARADIDAANKGTLSLKQQADAIRAADDALKQGESTRDAYLINKQADLEISQAMLITDAQAKAARLAEIEDLRRAQLEHLKIAAAVKTQEDAEKEAAARRKEIITNLLRSAQDAFSGFFVKIFDDGVSSFKELFGTIRSLFTKLIADMLAAKLVGKLVEVFFGDKKTSAATQQILAGGIMKDAATLQVQAANGMLAAAKQAQITPGGPNDPNNKDKLKPPTRGEKILGGAAIGFAGYGAGSFAGGLTTNRGVGVLGGAAAGAATGAAIGSIVPVIGTAIGAVIGGIAGAIGGFFGAGAAAKKAAAEAKALAAAQLDLAATMNILHMKSQGLNTDLAEALEANRKFFENLKQQIDAALPGKKNEKERNRERDDADRMKAREDQRIREDIARTLLEKKADLEVRALTAQGRDKEAQMLALDIAQRRELYDAEKAGLDAVYIARLKEVQELEKTAVALEALKFSKTLGEDLKVRLLRAQGHDKEADALALQLQQQREYDDAVKQGADAATLALLVQVQAAEKVKQAVNGLSTAVRNAPSGFKVESYINSFALARKSYGPSGTIGSGWETGLGVTPITLSGNPNNPRPNPGSPNSPSKGGTTTTNIHIGSLSFPLPPGMAPEKVGPAFMSYLRQKAAVTVGPNVPLADALDYA